MFPFRDHNPSRHVPFVTWGLIGVNFAIFFMSYLSDDWGFWVKNFALYPQEIVSGSGFYRLISSMFLHGSWGHIIGNMLFLYLFGDNVEDALGHSKFLIFYLLSGIIASLIYAFMNAHSFVPLIGASGAIAAVMGGYFLLYPRAKIDFLLVLIIYIRIIALPAWLVLGAWFGFQTIMSFGGAQEGANIAYLAHFGGFIFGFLLMLPKFWRLGGVEFWKNHHYIPPHKETEAMLYSLPKVKRGGS